MLNRTNKSRTYIESDLTKWMRKNNIQHSHLGNQLIMFPTGSLPGLVFYWIKNEITGHVYTVVRHYPYKKIEYQFPVTSAEQLLVKLYKHHIL